MNIVISDDYQDCVRHLDCFPLLKEHSVRIFNRPAQDTAASVARFVDADVLVLTRERTAISSELLDRLPKLRLISQTGRASSHIDLDACTEHGVAVMGGPSGPTPTAELTWALILASRRHLIEEVGRLHEGQWQGFVGQQLSGQRLGIWSYGRIGKMVADYGRAFGMRVWVWGREGSTSRARADGVAVAPSREAFFEDSDVVTLHLRLSDETRGIVTHADLTRMKPSALFVNTSRAQLVESGALEQALRDGAPGFGAVDVFENEPVTQNHPLLGLPNALCTPHIGFVERDNYENYYGTAFTNIARFAAGDFSGVINPEALMRRPR